VVKHGAEWVGAAETVANPEGHTDAEKKAAHETLNGFGQGVADVAAGAVGGGIGTLGVKMVGRAAGAATEAAEQGVADATTGQATPPKTAEVQTSEPPQPKTPEPQNSSTSPDAGTKNPVQNSPERQAPPAEQRAPGDQRQSHDAGPSVRDNNSNPVEIRSPDPNVREYNVGGKDYVLVKGRDQEWFYGQHGNAMDTSPIKMHVMISGPEDLARVQKVLIPFLRDNPQAKSLIEGWKTFDPKLGFEEGGPGVYMPGDKGQAAKGFTIYARSPRDVARLQKLIDDELHTNGLGLNRPPDSGNVDIIGGRANRVGVVRDRYHVTKDDYGNVGIELEGRLARQIGGRGHLHDHQLRAIERASGIKAHSLGYDRNGHLMLKLEDVSHKPRDGMIYVDESGANGRFGHMTDRRALYALANRYRCDPIRDVN
jgi:hypothetical protein